ncbi:conserved hypothetical protein [Vibrio chagasii]|uniref:DUF4760 domain-containing protein n=1 Tax=Vibrio splendidus TaxID=29497 RepID=A0AB35N303_VIBSP|nr:hypothetical protein [Vibrio splendidus]CAH6997983.1 conserved hypothetical protein [Vibrio chagasii]MDP2502986.1 hypothetical protein [Vibrio splendidus]MDP2590413.1 hypothetical protein [Vibrio splendidus]PMG54484.1 hypothetical protein BCU89_16090 [Vibrio splendidus]PMM15509.1 hypothetical protein BCT62_25120 [Vibrio splendidus]
MFKLLRSLVSRFKNIPKFYQTLLVTFFACILAFGLIAILFHDSDSYFVGNLLPELIGFSLEGLFFVCLLSVYSFHAEKRKDQIKKEESKKLILGIVNDYTSHVGKVLQPSVTFNLSDYIMREAICSMIVAKHDQDESKKEEIYFLTKAFLPIFNQHVATAYQIDKEHAESWQHIVIYLNYLANNPESSEAWEAFVKAINELKEWDILQFGE